MKHLDPEILAAYVDAPPNGPDAHHLRECARCRDELEALKLQTEALRDLPDLRIPQDDWDALAARLVSEGLMRPPNLRTSPALSVSSSTPVGPVREGGMTSLRPSRGLPPWLRVAAAAVLFLGGAGAGALASGAGEGPLGGMAGIRGGGGSEVSLAANEFEGGAAAETIEEAAAVLQLSEARYLSALGRYRELLLEAGGEPSGADPSVRYAALERLVAASQAAVREAPTDPFLNGVLLSAVAERQATLRSAPSSGGARRSAGEGWF
ncbi:MAG: hypothetical protein WEA09_08020 [Gemmatimonadota bacterium]